MTLSVFVRPVDPTAESGESTPVNPAGSQSLLPISIVTKVGLAWMAFWTCVWPPRMNVVRAFDDCDVGAVRSVVKAPGTPTLFRIATAFPRPSHVVAELLLPPSRAPVWKLTIGGGHPMP